MILQGRLCFFLPLSGFRDHSFLSEVRIAFYVGSPKQRQFNGYRRTCNLREFSWVKEKSLAR